MYLCLPLATHYVLTTQIKQLDGALQTAVIQVAANNPVVNHEMKL